MSRPGWPVTAAEQAGAAGTVRTVPAPDWSFARRPAWLASHLFAVAAIVTCVLLGFWQLDRLDQRQARNERVVERTSQPEVSVGAALAGGASPDELDYVAVRDRGAYLAEEQVVVRNRSQGGVAGSWIVAPLRTESGPVVLVNRGFVPDVTASPGDVEVPADPVEITGWLRPSQERGLGAAHPDEGRLAAVARIDVPRLDAQIPADLAPVWLQLGSQQPPPPDGWPDPVPLPELGEGSHLGYAVQWFIFGALAAIVYPLLLRRRAASSGTADPAPAEPIEVGERV